MGAWLCRMGNWCIRRWKADARDIREKVPSEMLELPVSAHSGASIAEAAVDLGLPQASGGRAAETGAPPSPRAQGTESLRVPLLGSSGRAPVSTEVSVAPSTSAGDPEGVADTAMDGLLRDSSSQDSVDDSGDDSDAAEESEQWVAWVSLDPRGSHGEPCVHVYPGPVALMIEDAQRKGERSVSLGEAFFGACVNLGERPEQRTRRGRRDVRRVVLPAQGGEAVFLVHEARHGWRMAEPPARGNELEARADIPPECAVELARIDELLEETAEAAAVAASAPIATFESSPLSAAEPVPEGMEALWEWCHALGASEYDCASLPLSAWGVYSAEQNSDIERALQAGGAGSHCAVTVGVREYEVAFSPNPNFARQTDARLHKSRLVRRRVVPRAEHELALSPPAPTTTRGEDTCALCAETFADTAAMPTVEIPECLHVFHQACAQQLVDENSRCPICRREVDWASLSAFRRCR